MEYLYYFMLLSFSGFVFSALAYSRVKARLEEYEARYKDSVDSKTNNK